MIRETTRLLRYARAWLGGRAPVEETEVEVDRGDRRVPATWVAREDSQPGPRPAWIVLHGITRRGREHEELRRFVRALAATQATVVVPEVPEWIDLRLAPDTTVPTVRGTVRAIRARDPGPAGIGLVGFSFGCPQAIHASAVPELRGRLDAVVGFGGYYDLERTVRFQLTGHHEWEGTRHHLQPDPYGRWIVFANHLTDIPGMEGAGPVARALWRLAAEAGDRQIDARHRDLDLLRGELRNGLDAPHRELFDRIAPPGNRDPEPEEVEDLVTGLVAATRRVSPGMDPSRGIGEVRTPVRLIHGKEDRLIPWSEALRMARALPDDTLRACTVTGLFAHSRGHAVLHPWERGREAVRFARALSGILGAV